MKRKFVKDERNSHLKRPLEEKLETEARVMKKFLELNEIAL